MKLFKGKNLSLGVFEIQEDGFEIEGGTATLQEGDGLERGGAPMARLVVDRDREAVIIAERESGEGRIDGDFPIEEGGKGSEMVSGKAFSELHFGSELRIRKSAG